MTQIATVQRIIDSKYEVISVPRKSACGHDCEECAGCGVSGAAVEAKALNPIGATPGEKVVVESSTQKMLGIVAFVYAIPVALFFLGYLTALILGATVAVQYTVAAIGFFAGVLLAVLYDRRIKAQGGLVFTIKRIF